MGTIHATYDEPLTAAQLRAYDRVASERLAIPSIVLMENAGRSVAEFVYGLLANPQRERVVVLAGSGNNGGDGFVVARHLMNAKVPVDVVLTTPADRVTGDAAGNLNILRRLGCGFIRAFVADDLVDAAAAIEAAHVVVDALLGTGASGPPRGEAAELIRLANAATRPRRVAVDVPSGLDADLGIPHDPCFRADATVTMVAPKLGFAVAAAREVLGRVVVVDIGISAAALTKFAAPGA